MAFDFYHYLRESTRNSGVPLKVQDVAVIASLAILVNATSES